MALRWTLFTMLVFQQSCFPAIRTQAWTGAWGYSAAGIGNFVEVHNAPISPFLHPVEVPLNGSTAIWCISRFSLFCIICRLPEGALCPIIQGINEDVKLYWSQYQPLGYSSSDLSPAGLSATDHNPLCLTGQSVHHTLHLPSLYFISVNKDVMGGSVESLTSVKINNICCFPLIHWATVLITQGHQVVLA